MTSINLHGIGDISERRLIERLSGWRLWAFILSFIVNLIFVTAMTFFKWQIGSKLFMTALWICYAQNALFALLVGAFRIPLSTKLAICCASFFGFGWLIERVFAHASVSVYLVYFLIELGIQSLLLMLASSLFWWRDKKPTFRFQVRDLLIVTTTIGVSIPIMKYLIGGNDTTLPLPLRAATILIPLSSTCWCIFITCCFVRGIIPEQFRIGFQASTKEKPTKIFNLNRWVALGGLLLVLVLAEFLEYYFRNGSYDHAMWHPRTVYLAWLFLSMVPVIGLEAKPRGLAA